MNIGLIMILKLPYTYQNNIEWNMPFYNVNWTVLFAWSFYMLHDFLFTYFLCVNCSNAHLAVNLLVDPIKMICKVGFFKFPKIEKKVLGVVYIWSVWSTVTNSKSSDNNASKFRITCSIHPVIQNKLSNLLIQIQS